MHILLEDILMCLIYVINNFNCLWYIHTARQTKVQPPKIRSTVKFSELTSAGTKKFGRFRGMAGFMRLPLQRIVRQGLKKLADIQGGPVF
jgi:hypothetical protein